jgi:hypothetical protein
MADGNHPQGRRLLNKKGKTKPVHAIAGALLGWYLMVPPVYDYQGNIVIGIHRPIRDWKIARTYKSAEQCQEQMKHLVETGAPSTPQVFALPLNGLGADATPIGQMLVRHATCIASDDPRLREDK